MDYDINTIRVKFCKDCGAKLNPSVHIVGESFDTSTGEKIREVKVNYTCPNGHTIYDEPSAYHLDSHGKYHYVGTYGCLIPISLFLIIVLIITLIFIL